MPTENWKIDTLSSSYINPDRLKIYLNVRFKGVYLVENVGDQYCIRTKQGLTPENLEEIKDLKATFRKNRKLYTRNDTEPVQGDAAGTRELKRAPTLAQRVNRAFSFRLPKKTAA